VLSEAVVGMTALGGHCLMSATSKVKYCRSVLACAASTLALCTVPAAQAADSGAIETVVVTAQKVAQPISKVPLTISALSGKQLRDHNYTDIEDFKGLVPGLQVSNYAGEARVNIRGIGMNSLSFGVDSQVAFSLNDVYLSSARAADQAFLDIDRIEVVRGPQGTLYGRNATGGAVNVITRRPTDEFEASAQIKIGNYDEVGTELIVSGPILGDSVMGRLAFSSEDHSGYAHNLFNNKHYDDAHTQTARGTLVFNLSDDVTLDIVADFHHQNDGNMAGHLFGTSPGFPIITGVVLGGATIPLDANGQAINPRLLNINTAPQNVSDAGGIVSELSWKLSDAFAFKSITAYRQESLSLTFDFDETPISFPSSIPGRDFIAYEGDRQVSQEIQFTGNLDWVNFVAGLYYFYDDVDPAFFWLGLNIGVPSAPFVVPVRLGGTTITDAYAVFGQATFDLTDKLHLTAGVRYSYERRGSTSHEELPLFGVVVNDRKSARFSDLSPKFGLDYQWTDELMTFITVAKGFQSGGFDISAQPPLVEFKPELVWDYEGGIKYHTDNLTVDLSAFHYDYSNLQVAQIVNGLPNTTNAATSKINGVEFSGTLVPTPGLSLTETFAYTDAYFTKFTEPDTLTGIVVNLANNQLPGAPKLSSNFTVEYSTPIASDNLTLFGEWNWHDRVYFTEFNSNQLSQGPVSTFNASIRYTFDDGRWTAELYGKNLSNELLKTQAWITGAGFGSMVLGHLAPPRTFGVIVRYQFN
jgi:iron complex outermembrane receptor protein